MFFNMSGVNVRRIENKIDYRSILYVRKMCSLRQNRDLIDYADKLDIAPNTTLLLAEDNEANPIGTLRIMNRAQGAIKLDRNRHVEDIVIRDTQDLAEVSCFAVPSDHIERHTIILALYKAFYRYCKSNDISVGILSSSFNLYEVNKNLVFKSESITGLYEEDNKDDFDLYTYILDMSAADDNFKSYQNFLYEFMTKLPHRNISF